jgi:hypothetical protein
MGNNAALDVAIALVLMYLLISIMVTVVNEMLATAMKLRASTLRSALENIIDNPSLRQDFYNHGLIAGTEDALKGQHVSYLSGQTFALAILGSLDPTKPIPGFADAKSAIETMPDTNIRDALLAQLTLADNDLQKLRDGIAGWFDSAMDRVGGAYKRNMKWISLAVGLAITLILGADTIQVGRAIWVDSTLRAQIVQAAAGVQASYDPKAVSNKPLFDKLKGDDDNIRALPIGWQNLPDQLTWSSGVTWLVKFIGLILTALAVSLGAPFWFDLLSKFMNVRGTGQRPPRSNQT